MIRVFIGFDVRESVAFSVLAHSIHTRSSLPVSIAPLMLSQLRGSHWRERHPLQSTDFAFSRFLVPHLCEFRGWAIFMDCDMLMRADLAGLWALRDERHALQVVQHTHVPRESTKFLSQPQTRYEKKNWSSVMLFNNAKCTALTPDYVNRASGLELHQFKWLGDDSLIGPLPPRWNHLVSYDEHDPEAALVHFTSGGPYFRQFRTCPFADEWIEERERMLAVEDEAPAARAAASLALARS